MVDSLASLDDNPAMLDSKYDSAPGLYEQGLSVGEIADFFSVTRQAMWKILQRRGVVFRPQTRDGEDNHFYRGGTTHVKRAHNLVEKAVAKGILVPRPCEVCGNPKAQAHHDDYQQPLQVRWLCKKHHHEWHKHNSAKNRKEVAHRTLPARRPDVITGGVP
jgi:hypothetical protein